MYAIEASSVASRRYFLETSTKLIKSPFETETEYRFEKVSSLRTLFYGGLVLIPECKFQAREYAPEPWDSNGTYHKLLEIISTFLSSLINQPLYTKVAYNWQAILSICHNYYAYRINLFITKRIIGKERAIQQCTEEQ